MSLLASMAELRSPDQCQADHSRRAGIAACIRGIFPLSALRHGQAKTGFAPARPPNRGAEQYFNRCHIPIQKIKVHACTAQKAIAQRYASDENSSALFPSCMRTT